MRSNPLVKMLVIPLAVVVLGISLLAIFTGRSKEQKSNDSRATFITDKASGDTAVETLKTLTAEVSAVEQQNKEIIAQNKALSEQDQTTLVQFKNDLLSNVQQQVEKFKIENQSTINEKNLPADDASELDKDNGLTMEKGFTWVSDMQGKSSNSNDELDTVEKTKIDITQPAVPYYTIPVNATLTGAIAMQPLIGRIPIGGKVPDPYTFKVVMGAKNLAANGVDIPEDIQGIVASGIAEGDLLGRCARGDIRSMTFVFQDGRISTTQAKDGEVLGTIAAANGNPCIQGQFFTDAPLFLGVTAGLAGIQGYGNALSQSQLNSSVSPAGNTISSIMGNANQYAVGQGASAAAQATQRWWDQRVESSFDFIYVPNINPKTGEKLKLNINIAQEIAIDNDSTKRKVFYNHDKNTSLSNFD